MAGGSTNETWLGTLVPGPTRGVAAPQRALTEVPDHIGPYAVEELVGRGGMAAVYRCRDEVGELVAVKWLHMPSQALEQRFAAEIRALARIHHPSVVRYLDHGSQDNRPYLVMELLQGDDLRLWTYRSRRLPSLERGRRVRALAVRLCEALGHLHEHGLVHRDVKPSNVIVLDNDMPVLTDFGVVKDLDDGGETAVGVVVGTLNYAAPEQLRGEPVDARTDLYGLGCTLYYMLTGRVPFEQVGQAELVMAHLSRPPTPPSHHEPSISADLEQVVLRLMAKEPSERYASAAEVAAALSTTPTPAGVPLAGRKQAMQLVAEALERVAGGQACVVRVSGRPGTGKTWAMSTLQEGALRRGLPYLEPREPAALEAALERLAEGEALLVATELPVDAQIHIQLEPLGRADLRRSVVAAAPGTRDPAALAERLYRATGGLPVLLLPLLEALAADPDALRGPLPPIPVDRWFEGLDLDTLEVLQAVAAARAPISAVEVEAATQVPAEDPLRCLLEQGLIVAASAGGDAAGGAGHYGRRYAVAAEAFAVGALALAPDPQALHERVQQALGPRADDGVSGSLRQVHELLETGQLAAAEQEIVTIEGSGEVEQVGVMLARARLDWMAGRQDAAHETFARVMTLAPADRRAGITARIGLAVLARQRGEPRRATALLEEAELAARRAGQLDLEAMAAISGAWGAALAGRPGPALRAVTRLVGVARALERPVLECQALEVQGRLLLELGMPLEAGRVLADISALAHAAGLRRERWQAHVLRARATLDLDPGSPTSAAAATDRLLRVLGEPPAPDPLCFVALAHALRARASARLSDARTCRSALERARTALGSSSAPLALITRIQLARASWVSGDAATARATLDEVERRAGELGYAFTAFQARKLEASMRGAQLDEPTTLLEGLDPCWAEAMTREPEPR